MVTIRRFRFSDLDTYVLLLNEIEAVDLLGRGTSIEQTSERFACPGYQPEQDIFIAEEQDSLIGYAEIHRELEIGRVVAVGAVHPAHRGHGIGSALLDAVMAHSKAIRPDVVHIPITRTASTWWIFIEKRGFSLIHREQQMVLRNFQLQQHTSLRPGFEMRHFLPGDEEDLCQLQNIAFSGRWGFHPNNIAEIRHQVNSSLCEAEGIPIIIERDRIVAYAWTAADAMNRSKGYILMLGVHPGYRNLGLGRAILVAAIEHLRNRGKTVIQLAVDDDNNPAKKLYRSLGFRHRRTTLWYERRIS